MATPHAGPSHPQAPAAPAAPAAPGAVPPQMAGAPKRPAEADADAARRLKHPRPPLPPPHVLQSLVPDSPAFTELMKIEQKLDWTLLRKKAEINDALGRSTRVKRTLRVFLSNTVHDQAWQSVEQPADGSVPTAEGAAAAAAVAGITIPTGETEKEGEDVVMGEDNKEGDEVKKEGDGSSEKEADKPKTEAAGVDVNTGKGVAGWVMRIEGRLLDTGNHRLDKQKRKFSQFLRSVVVEFDNREAPTYPEGNIVEWHPSPTAAPLDGFEILRRGDENVKARVVLHIAHSPERFKVISPLSELISMREGTRAEVMAAVWQLVKTSGAQDKEDPTIVRPVGGLEKIMSHGAEGIQFHQIPETIARFLAHPEPVIIPYEIDVGKEFSTAQRCFDIPIEIEDPLKSKLASLIQNFEGQAGTDIVKLEDKVSELAYFARDLKQKRDFLDSFAASPHAFIHNWLGAQARDLDQMLGFQIRNPATNADSIREEDLRRSDLFSLPWVTEAIGVHEAERTRGP